MNKPSMNLQDSFLNQVRKDGSEVKIVMLDGSQLIGYVRGFDNFTVVFHCQGMQHLLYKHAIAQIVSPKPGQRETAPPRRREEAPSAREGSPPSDNPSSAKTPFNALDFSSVKASEPS